MDERTCRLLGLVGCVDGEGWGCGCSRGYEDYGKSKGFESLSRWCDISVGGLLFREVYVGWVKTREGREI